MEITGGNKYDAGRSIHKFRVKCSPQEQAEASAKLRQIRALHENYSRIKFGLDNIREEESALLAEVFHVNIRDLL